MAGYFLVAVPSGLAGPKLVPWQVPGTWPGFVGLAALWTLLLAVVFAARRLSCPNWRLVGLFAAHALGFWLASAGVAGFPSDRYGVPVVMWVILRRGVTMAGSG